MRRACFFALLVPWLAACAPLRMSIDEVAKLGPGEGVVVGSIQIAVNPESASDQWVLFTLKDTKWAAKFAPAPDIAKDNPTRRLLVLSDTEEYFVSKLPAGEYRLLELSRTDTHLSGNADRVALRARFTVHPGETTYVGRLRVTLPYSAQRTGLFSGFGKIELKVQDVLNEAKAALLDGYGDILRDARTHLMLEY